jgi:hypothetical protein
MLLQGGAGALSGGAGGQSAPVDPREQESVDFLEVVLADTEDVWNRLFLENSDQYKEPVLHIFRDQVQSGCGYQSAQVGPFYCPADQKVYLDLGFFDQLARDLQAAGDFAQAYVVAHEVGHHVQNLLGFSDQVNSQRGRVSEAEQNRLSVRLELQADYLAGVWAHHAQKMAQVLEPGDLEEALNAANQIGDDRLQKRASGTVMPESFTHGTSAQRQRWFKRGFDTGSWAGMQELFKLPYDRL